MRECTIKKAAERGKAYRRAIEAAQTAMDIFIQPIKTIIFRMGGLIPRSKSGSEPDIPGSKDGVGKEQGDKVVVTCTIVRAQESERDIWFNAVYLVISRAEFECSPRSSWEDPTLTVNLVPCTSGPDYAFLDTNNCGQDCVEWLVSNGFGHPTGITERNGFCAYPEFQFSEERLRAVDPEGYAEHVQQWRNCYRTPETPGPERDEHK